MVSHLRLHATPNSGMLAELSRTCLSTATAGHKCPSREWPGKAYSERRRNDRCEVAPGRRVVFGTGVTMEDDWRTSFRPDIPSSARIYDYFLGGKDNFPADREAAEEI